jgi:lipoprotein-releasing system permease protein
MFELKVASRYLWSTRLQSALLVSGVALGVVVFTFIAALINGLGKRLTDDVVGNVGHVTLEAPARLPSVFLPTKAARSLVAVQPGHDVTPQIRTYRPVLVQALAHDEVRVAVAQVVGNATLARGEKDIAVSVTGVAQQDAGEIAQLDGAMVRGRLDLGVGNLLIGVRLANELGVDVGDRVILRPGRAPSSRARVNSTRSDNLIFTIRGLFSLGVQALDERSAFMDLGIAQNVFGVPGGVTRIELKVADVWRAPRVAQALGRATGLKATHWLERNERLQEGLKSQQRTGTLIKAFSLMTIIIGVASALLLAVLRRRSEIGIMRSFGISRAAIVRVFVLQGLIVGAVGALAGATLGFAFCNFLFNATSRADGSPSIPIDPAQGEYARAWLLATAASGLAAILPARSAATIDPLKAIQS